MLPEGVFDIWMCGGSSGLASGVLGEGGAVGSFGGTILAVDAVVRDTLSWRSMHAWWIRTFSFHSSQSVIWAYSSL